MAKKYNISNSEPDPDVINEPAVDYKVNVSANEAEIDADNDLERAITGEELLKRLEPRIKKLFE